MNERSCNWRGRSLCNSGRWGSTKSLVRQWAEPCVPWHSRRWASCSAEVIIEELQPWTALWRKGRGGKGTDLTDKESESSASEPASGWVGRWCLDSQPKPCAHTANPLWWGRSEVNPGNESVAGWLGNRSGYYTIAMLLSCETSGWEGTS